MASLISRFILLKSAYDCRDPQFWDLQVGDTVYHGNYQKCRNIDDVVKYIKKDGRLVVKGGGRPQRPEPGRPGEIVWAGEQVWETLRHRRFFFP